MFVIHDITICCYLFSPSNLAVMLFKFGAYLYTGSATMLSESIHSLADMLNQVYSVQIVMFSTSTLLFWLSDCFTCTFILILQVRDDYAPSFAACDIYWKCSRLSGRHIRDKLGNHLLYQRIYSFPCLWPGKLLGSWKDQ